MKLLPFSFLIFLGLSVHAQKKHSVYFEHDQADVSQEERDSLTEWLKTISDTATKVEIIGFADHLGTDEYNLKLSERRAKSVASLIESKSEFHYRMSLTEAKGESLSAQPNSAERQPEDRRVDVIVSEKGKRAVSQPKVEQITIPEPDSDRPKMESDLLVRAEVGQIIVLKNLNFFPGRHFLIPQALPELERLAQIMKENPQMEIEILGHICCKLDTLDGLDVNTQTYTLSQNRAEYIFDQLVLAGIEPKRMRHRGFAGSRPLVNPEMTDEDRQRNRRVEIRILKK